VKTINIHTDQNVRIEIELASIAQRFAAAVLDVVILAAYFGIMSVIIAMVFLSEYRWGEEASSRWQLWEALYYIIVFLPFLLYTPLMEYFTKGQTIGKMAVGIRVVKTNGDNAEFRDYFTRWLFRPIEFYILNIVGIGFFMAVINIFVDVLLVLVSGRAQRLGDYMSNTVVVKKNPHRNYSLKDVLSIKTNDAHTPSFPNVVKFTDEDMMLIKRTIARVEKFQNPETKKFAIELANITAKELGLEQTPEKKLQFLKTVLDDYIVLTR
jgi:uncharacterized RDD family membrane protein YckC